MKHSFRWPWAALVVATGLCGCSFPATRPCSPSCPAAQPAPELPAVARGSVEANLHAMPSLPRKDGIPTSDPPPSPPYKALTAAQAQCLAANAAVPANLQTQEAGLAGGKGDRGGDLRRDVLAYSAQELRNRSAGGALEMYYRLAEAEGKADLLTQGIAQLEKAVRETQDMLRQKLKPPVALDVWTRQLLTMQSDQVTADMTISQLNGDLRRLLGLADCGEGWRIWNPEGYDVTDAPIDAEAAVAEACAHRAELLLLRAVLRDLDAGSLPAARDLLRTISPLLGAAHPLLPCVAKVALLLHLPIGGRAELDVRRRQLTEYLHEREAAVADEVRQAAAALRYRGRLAALAWERERSWEEKLREVQSRQQQGLAPFAEVVSTTLELLKARGEVIAEVMAWHIARVKLRQAQGLLAAECAAGGCAGLGAPVPAGAPRWR